MTNYVLGFLFDSTFENVVLIRKKRPDWQSGRLNGVGGHVETGELLGVAMTREFKEETGLEVTDWTEFSVLKGADYRVYCFFSARPTLDVQTTTDEEILVVPARKLPADVLPNLKWLVPLALDQEPNMTVVNYA